MSRKDYSPEEVELALRAFAVEGGRQKATEKFLRDAKLKIPFGTVRNWAYRTYHERYEHLKLEVETQQRVKLADNYYRIAGESNEVSEDVLHRIRERFLYSDRELAECDRRLADAEDLLGQLNALIDADQRAMAVELEIPDADALIEEILGEPGDVELDRVTVARMNSNYKRRAAIVDEMKTLWQRRADLEVGFKELTGVLRDAGIQGGIASEKLLLLTGQATDRVEHSFPELQRALEAKGIRLAVGQGAPRALPAPVIEVPADG
jgi:hypothetical protein